MDSALDPAAYIRNAIEQAPLFADRPSDSKMGRIDRVGIIGSGTMGVGIALAFLDAGIDVLLFDQDRDALDRGLGRITSSYDDRVARGRISGAESVMRQARLQTAGELSVLATCDLVIEAVFESLAVKQELFAKLDGIARVGAILATNTSYLDVDQIAGATGRPQDVIGLHFFSPANVMRLIEIVRGAATSPDVIVAALDLARRIGKIGVIARVGYGFIGNRMLQAYVRQANLLLLEGASPEQIDGALTGFGFSMGPFQVADLAGLDVSHRARQERQLSAEEMRAYMVPDRLVEAGRLGLKTGAGFYDYAPGGRTPAPSPVTAKLIAAAAHEQGLQTRTIDEVEILERCLFVLVNEGIKLLEEGIAARASDVDLVYLNGYGFPAARGGPLFWAEHVIGLRALLDGLRRYRATTGLDGFVPARLLEQLVDSSVGRALTA
jgi:3-hydroxyacyl-CoA dehydrogenase